MSHSVLILSQTFFPDPKVGSIRMTEWCRHLPEFGWKPHVLARHFGFTATPELLGESINSETQVQYIGERRSPNDPHSNKPPPVSFGKSWSRKVIKRAIDGCSIPDTLIWSWKSLRQEAISHAKASKPDVIISTSPIHSIHWLGHQLARELGKPWIVDFRDPYLIDPRYTSSGLDCVSRHFQKRFERKLYAKSQGVIHAIPIHGRWARSKYKFARERIHVIPNGIPVSMADAEKAPNSNKEQRFCVVCAGNLTEELHNGLVNAVLAANKAGLKVHFFHCGYGPSPPKSRFGIFSDCFQFRGRVAHEEAIARIASADLLVNALSPARANSMGLSSKLFEYLNTGKPILSLNPTRSDRQLTRRLDWVVNLASPNAENILQAISRSYDNRPTADPKWLSNYRERFNRRRQTNEVAEILDQLVKR